MISEFGKQPILQQMRQQLQQQQKLAKKIKNFIYDPSDVVGSGFSSKVYKGINQHNSQQVAIKVIELLKIQNQVEKYLLNNQINALRALKHKNVLKTIDILMTKNNVYIVTEFCQYGDLQHMIKNNKKLNQKDSLNIIKDIVEGYIAIEQKNIIHRDMKTANIFLTKAGAKIADFGFCQFIGQKKPQIAYNVGSPAYMSPQSYKQNYYSPKSDIWGIGTILYEMLIGQTPQKNLTYTEMSNNLMNGKINCGSNQQIKKILTYCFKKDIKERVDTKTLLIMVNSAIDNLTRILGLKDSSRINPFDGKMVQIPILQQQQDRSNNYRRQGLQFLRSSTDDKPFNLNQSPSNMLKIIKNNQLQEPKNNSMINPGSIKQNGSAKKQVPFLSTSGVISNFKNVENNEFTKNLKSYLTMLQFIFRIFKYVNEISIPTLPFLRLLLFRHRSHIDQLTQSLVQIYRIDTKNSQLYKQFQYLKMKFDENYLQKENNINIFVQQNHELMQTMNRLANISFIENQCLKAYKQIIRKGCEEIQLQINQNRSNAYVLWDYLMIQFQILNLYSQEFSDNIIVNQKCFIQQTLKQKPNSINKNHVQLLKIKNQYIFEIINNYQIDNARKNNYMKF